MEKSTIVGAVTAIAAATVAYLCWPNLLSWTDAHPGLASWVQAIGSVGAIFIAAWAVNRSHALQRNHREIEVFDQHTRFLESAFQIVGGAAQVVGKVFDTVKQSPLTPDEFESVCIELETLATALSRIDHFRLDRYEFVEAVLVSEMLIRKLLGVAKAVQGIGHSSLSLLEPDRLRDTAEITRGELKSRAAKFMIVIESRGGHAVSDLRPLQA